MSIIAFGWGFRVLRGLRHRKTGLSQVLAVLALVAMSVRALVPVGYMLAASPDRFITVTLCSAHGGVEVTLDRQTGAVLDHKPAPANDKSHDGGPCVFAAAATLAAPTIAPPVVVALGTAIAAPLINYQASPGRGLAAPPPWATGPPQQA